MMIDNPQVEEKLSYCDDGAAARNEQGPPDDAESLVSGTMSLQQSDNVNLSPPHSPIPSARRKKTMDSQEGPADERKEENIISLAPARSGSHDIDQDVTAEPSSFYHNRSIEAKEEETLEQQERRGTIALVMAAATKKSSASGEEGLIESVRAQYNDDENLSARSSPSYGTRNKPSPKPYDYWQTEEEEAGFVSASVGSARASIENQNSAEPEDPTLLEIATQRALLRSLREGSDSTSPTTSRSTEATKSAPRRQKVKEYLMTPDGHSVNDPNANTPSSRDGKVLDAHESEEQQARSRVQRTRYRAKYSPENHFPTKTGEAGSASRRQKVKEDSTTPEGRSVNDLDANNPPSSDSKVLDAHESEGHQVRSRVRTTRHGAKYSTGNRFPTKTGEAGSVPTSPVQLDASNSSQSYGMTTKSLYPKIARPEEELADSTKYVARSYPDQSWDQLDGEEEDALSLPAPKKEILSSGKPSDLQYKYPSPSANEPFPYFSPGVMMPGAYAIHSAGDGEEDITSLGTLNDDVGRWNVIASGDAHNPFSPVIATAVDEESRYVEEEKDDSTAPIVFATKDGFLHYVKQDRRTQMGLACLVLLVIGLTVGLVTATLVSGSSSSADKKGPTNENYWFLAGSEIDGSSLKGQFGASVSMSSDGTRVAVASPGVWNETGNGSIHQRGVARVYEEDQDGEWTPLGSEIWGDFMDERSAQSTEIPVLTNRLVASLSRDGNWLAIGSSFHDTGEKKNVGQAEVYRLISRSWERMGEAIVGEEEGDFFGASISISSEPYGGIVAIGAPGHDSSGGNETGRVSVYQFNRNKWSLRGDPFDGAVAGEMCGSSVSLLADGNMVAVASSTKGMANESTVARIFQFKNGDWEELGSGIKGGVGEYDTGWLTELSADGETVVISNFYMNDDGPEVNSNRTNSLVVKAFRYDGNDWSPIGDNMHALVIGDKSGYYISVSDDGNLIGMGDPGKSVDGGKISGHAHIYKFDGSEWHQSGPNIEGEAAGDMFGFSVSLSGDGSRFAIGAPFNRGKGSERGRVKVYEVPK